MADPRTINYAGGQKIYNKEKVDQEIDTKIAAAVDPLSDRLDAEIVRAKGTEGDLDDLVTTDKSNLVAAINEVKQSAYTVDEHVTAGSTNPVESSGVKEYVDTQDVATLQSAKDYTDGRIGEFHPEDGSTVVELTGHLDDLNNAAESLVQAINNIDTRVEQNRLGIGALETSLEQESAARIHGDQELDTKITQVDQAKQDKLTFDDEPTHGSDNPVKSTGIKDYVDEITGQLEDLETPAESLVSAINALDDKFKDPDTEMSDDSENAVQNKVIKAYVDDKDTTPTKDSEKAVTSDGIYKAIKKAGVKIGEIMDWPQFQIETRTMVSDNPFEFTFAGQTHSVAVDPEDVELEIADNVPEGWAAMNGTAVLDAATNQELANFFGGRNTTTDGKIWIPYLPRKIIKVAY